MASTRHMASGLSGYVGPGERERLRMQELRALRAAIREQELVQRAGDDVAAVSASGKDIRRATAAGQAVVPPVSAGTRGR